FQEPVAVSLGGIGQNVVFTSGSQVVFITTQLVGSAIPQCDIQSLAALLLTNVAAGASASGPGFTFDGPPSPLILGVSPSSTNIGGTVTLTGRNFDPNAPRAP